MVDSPKVYNPKSAEDKWYKHWLEKRYFNPLIDEGREPFTVVIPPPNVTGSLHMGHALNNVLQDIIVRKKRMEGYVTLWLPGTDHAGIATQNVVEQQLAEEGLSRRELGRREFIKRVWVWKEQYGSLIIDQLKRLGCSCDWSRERFTMDENYSRAVRQAFVELYRDGLIYRGDYIINWCPRCRTALSDIEVDYREVQGNLWYIRYPFKDSEEDYITLATTRPETLLGDVAVAVNQKDERYKGLKGKTLILPVLKREIPLIEDFYVDPEFGTGAVKVTPAHDRNDFEIGERHKLDRINIFSEEAKINEKGGLYEGMDRYECRRAIVKDLEKANLLEKVEPYIHAVGHCYRCDTPVEPYLSRQWFVKMAPLAQPAVEAAEKNEVDFVPKRWVKVFYEWIENIRDWCISRQIWWGHQLPVYYCKQGEVKSQKSKVKNNGCGEIIVSIEKPLKCPKCGSTNLKQDPDVLDTWFSSALWPFATLGWPEKTADLSYFYPTSLLSTGFDILYFWVARMIMMGLYFVGKVPFYEVYIHALIRDAEGKKMSKSRGNVIDPMETIDKYGTDALRFTLASLAVPGRDVFLSEERLEGSRHFINKIWNASRFVLINLGGYSRERIDEKKLKVTLADQWILSRYVRTIKKVNQEIESFDFSGAAYYLKTFFWGDFCDWYLELCKIRLGQSEDQEARETAQHFLIQILEGMMRLLHPIIPFITEEIWQKLPGAEKSIMVAPYPTSKEAFIAEKVEGKMNLIKKATTAIRSLRSEYQVAPYKKIKVFLQVSTEEYLEVIQKYKSYLTFLAGISDLVAKTKLEKPSQAVVAVEQEMEVFVPLKDLVDIEKESKRLEKELASIQTDLARCQGKLENGSFLNKAPKDVVQREKKKFEDLNLKKEKLLKQLKELGV